jgi:sec-independent protein translocase protein TatC
MREMSLIDHLEELKGTAIKIALILFLGFLICYGFSDDIASFLLKPLEEALEGSQGSIVYLGVLDKMISEFTVAFWSGILLTSPLWFYQIWAFIRPGLYNHEAKIVRPFILVGFLLFCLGVTFGYFLVFPLTFKFLMNFGADNVVATINFREHLVLCTKVLLFLGLIFQLPNLLLILGFMGLVTKYSLREKRRYVYVGLAVFSAVITPPDVLTMLGLWFPLILLYESGILAVSFVVHPYLARQHLSS